MSHKLECPWCGMVAGSYDRLARHLTSRFNQNRRRCLGRWEFISRGVGWNECVCFCGQLCNMGASVSDAYPLLAEHLRTAGGITAHLLAVTLGINKDA